MGVMRGSMESWLRRMRGVQWEIEGLIMEWRIVGTKTIGGHM